MKKRERKKKKYEQELLQWEQQNQQAKRTKGKVDLSTRPQEPQPVCLLIPANSSRAWYLTHLRDNKHLGGIIHTSEADELAFALGQDYGKQGDLLRKAFHHEPVAASHKANGKPIRILRPRLASCMTTTPSQLIGIIPHVEDGLYSRFLFLTQPAEYTWRSPQPQEVETDTEKLFTELGETVMRWHMELLKEDTRVNFTPCQWKSHTRLFESRLQEIAFENKPYAVAILFRYGLMTMRIAALLTTLRKCEDQLWSSYRTCSDEDMDTALKITETCLEHSLLLSSSLKECSVQANPLKPFRRLQIFLDKLPTFFTYTQMLQIAEECGISRTTAKRDIRKAITLNLLEHKGTTYQKKPDAHSTGA
ncbi:MAG: DUF3987 domain-containing protein [Bacteroides sp.]|nr:DUF3987 domain-containing protein [Bacteroides sp.]